MEVKQHVLKVSTFDCMRIFSPSLCGSFGEGHNLVVLFVPCGEDVVLLTHAHFDIIPPLQYGKGVDVASGVWIQVDELKVLGESQAYVLSEVVIYALNERHLLLIDLAQFVVILLGILKHFISREVVCC